MKLFDSNDTDYKYNASYIEFRLKFDKYFE